jgi:hypothetical protein
VHEVLAADRSDLARAKKPAAGAPPSSEATASASWPGTPNIPEPRPLHANTSAPAGCRPPSASIRTLERLVQVAVGAGGVARVQPHDLAGPHLGAERDLPGVRIRAHEPADEEVALHVLRLVVVDHDPHQQPAVDQVAVVVGEALDRLAQLRERRLARQLADDVPVGRGDRQLRPDRGGALGDAGRISTPSSRTPTAPPSTTSSPRKSAGPSLAVRAEPSRPAAGAAASPR